MKKVLKWVGIAILVPILLFFLLAVLLYLPPVQNWAVKQVAAIASDKTGMDITVEHVNLEFPLNLGVEGVRVLRPNDSIPNKKDTVADITKMVVNVQLKPLLKKQVEVDALELNQFKFNTTDFISDTRVKGSAGRLYLESHGINLKDELLRVNKAMLSDANVIVELSDTVPPDTTESENFWKIYVDRLEIDKSNVTVHLPGDTLQVGACLGKTVAENGKFDLYKGEYKVGRFDWQEGCFSFDNNFEPNADGLDYNHLLLSDIDLQLDSFSYGDSKLETALEKLTFKEKSGITVNDLSGPISLDSTKVSLPALTLRTPESSLDARVEIDFDAFSDKNPGRFDVVADGTFGKQDLMRFMGNMPQGFVRKWPNQPLTVKGVAKGNMKHLDIAGLHVNLPTALKLNAKGSVDNLDDADRLKADLNVDATANNINFLTSLLEPGTLDGIRIPNGIGVKGNVKADGPRYAANVIATEGNGKVKLKADLDTKTMAYVANVDARQLQLEHFLPGQGLGVFTGTADVTGNGTDLLSKQMRLQAKANIEHFTYGDYNLDGMSADASVSNGRINACVNANNPLLKGIINFNALTSSKKLDATFSADISHADLYQLKIADEPLTITACGHFDVASDLKDAHKIQGMASDITILTKGKTYRPDDIVLDVLTRRDTTHAVVDCGDFHLDMDASSGYQKLIDSGERIFSTIDKQFKDKHIDQEELRKYFPTARISLQSGEDNIFSRILAYYGLSFDDVRIDMTSSPASGLNGSAELLTVLVDSIQLDTVRLNFVSDSTNIAFNGQVRNNKKNPQFIFNAQFDGLVTELGAGVNLRYYDERDRLGIRLGAEAEMAEGGLRFHMLSKDAVIAYKNATINEDNYVFLADNKRVSANLAISTRDGTGLKIYSNDENPDVLQDLTFSLHRLNLEELLSVVPYLPRITGMLDGDYHIVQDAEHLSVSSTMSIDDMTYEGSRMGNIGTEFVYLPSDEGTHSVDGILIVDDHEVGGISGTYHSEGQGDIDAVVNLKRLPISLVNGFIPDQIIGFKGYGEGELTVKGTLDKPRVNGEVFLDSCHLVSEPYSIDLRFSNDPVRIVGSHLLLENFELYAYNANPINTYGEVDFSNLDNVKMNVKMRAENLQLINAKETPKSIAFGKAFVNFFGNVSGPLANLSLRGKLDVLGKTDIGYILRDSPLTTDNQLDELVKFTSFTDTTEMVVNRPPIDGFNMDIMLSVVSGAHVMAYLNSDHTNYVDLMGGGSLRMSYNSADDFRLTGRYTLNNGQMKYSLPVIPLKTFTIRDGSYIEFKGDPMNPTLNITATEQAKSNVSNSDGTGRTVDFDCGVIITKTLKDIGLQFIIDAPQDLEIRNQLLSMTLEQRGKLAVTLLTTGMYLADGNTNAFSMNSALSAFLESEINNITGNALRTLDLSFGLNNSTDASGVMYTDYSFKFAKRFWNNRLKISIGGVVSSGTEMQGRDRSFFDNVSMEYRLDDTANKYVKLFYENNSYDWLEGYTRKYGGGFIWKRTLQHFKDIFRFSSSKESMPPAMPERDSIVIDTLVSPQAYE